MKIALAHDSFTQLGGAERVVEAFHEMYPSAPVFTLVLDKDLKSKYKDWDIRTSWLQVLYNIVPKLQWLLPFIPLAVRSLSFEGYDIVLSSSSGFIKNIKVPKKTKHINYCHTPTRFLWLDKNYLNQEVPKFLKFLVYPVIYFMKKWDFKGAQRVTEFVSNSNEVKKRIKTLYKRDSIVIYPFIESEFWHKTTPKENYFLLVNRLQAHKNNEFVINIFNELNIPLHIVGTGRQEKFLKSIAKSNIRFLGRIDDEKLINEYSSALALIYPQNEDFGLVPLEAAMCGTATLAYGKGGALETVVEGKTGIFFNSYDSSEILKIINNWDSYKFDESALVNHAKTFNKQNFKQQILEVVNKVYEYSY